MALDMLLHDKRTQGWQELLKLLIGLELFKECKITFDPDNFELAIQASPPVLTNIKDKLEVLFSSQRAFLDALPYQHVGTATAAVSTFSVETPVFPQEKSEVIGVLVSLFPEALARQLVVHFEGDDANLVNGVLCSTHTRDDDQRQIWEHQMHQILKHLNGASIDALQQAWVNQDIHLSPPAPDLNAPSTEALNVIPEIMASGCFKVAQYGDDVAKTAQLQLDLKTLWELTFPPVVVVDRDQVQCIKLDARHLANFAVRANGGPTFLTVPDTDGAAHPMILPTQTGVVHPLSFSLMLDRSGSMSDGFERFKSQVCEFIRALVAKCREILLSGTVNIFWFDNTIMAPITIDINHRATDSQIEVLLNKVAQDLMKVTTGGGTALWDAFKYGLRELHTPHQDLTRCAAIFTDGGDTTDGTTKALCADYEAMQKAETDPSIMIIGAGSSLKGTLLEELARTLNGEYRHIAQSTDLLEMLSTKLEQFTTPSTAHHFLLQYWNAAQKLHEQQIHTRVYADAPKVLSEVAVPVATDSQFQANTAGITVMPSMAQLRQEMRQENEEAQAEIQRKHEAAQAEMQQKLAQLQERFANMQTMLSEQQQRQAESEKKNESLEQQLVFARMPIATFKVMALEKLERIKMNAENDIAKALNDLGLLCQECQQRNIVNKTHKDTIGAIKNTFKEIFLGRIVQYKEMDFKGEIIPANYQALYTVLNTHRGSGSGNTRTVKELEKALRHHNIQGLDKPEVVVATTTLSSSFTFFSEASALETGLLADDTASTHSAKPGKN